MLNLRTPAMRGVRAGGSTCAVLALAVGAHVVGHGSVPPVLSWVPVIAIVFAIAYVLSMHRLRTLQLIGLIGSAQLVVHALSTYLDDHSMVSSHPLLMLTSHVGATFLTAFLIGQSELFWWQFLAWLAAWRSAEWKVVRPLKLPELCPEGIRKAQRGIYGTAVGLRGPPLLTRN